MKIYRLEDPKTGFGPFNDGSEHERDEHLWIISMYCKAHPEQNINDQIKANEKALGNRKIRYGCVSLEALNTWFPEPCQESLHEFKLFVYELPDTAPHVVVEAGQVLFVVADTTSRTLYAA